MELDPAALELLERYGGEILAHARRFSSTPEDAEDAYQRALEILLTKAPTTAEQELVPWLKTVVKHEAFALRRQRDRATPTTTDGELAERPTGDAATHDQAERRDRLRLGAEAMRRLKPQEVRCLLLKAEGYSYKEICEVTGWTYTKVNRCLTEGRKAFLERVAGIEAGAECERLMPLLSALADGEASAAELRVLRPHLRTCLACRARLKEFRAAPARVAALVPPALAATAGDAGGPLRGLLESLVGAAQGKAAAMSDRVATLGELAAGQKVAAVAASAAALAGGGAAVDRLAGHQGPPQQDRAEVRPVEQEVPVPEPAPPQPAPEPPAPPPSTSPQPAPAPPAPPPPDPASEFSPAAPSGTEPAPSGSGLSPGGGGGDSGGGGGDSSGGGGEFAP